MGCEGPIKVTRPLASAEMCLSARAGVERNAEDHGLFRVLPGRRNLGVSF